MGRGGREWRSFEKQNHWLIKCSACNNFLKNIFIIYLFLEREGEREGDKLRWERNIDWLPLVHSPNGDRTHNSGICSDQESNRWPFTLQDNVQPMEPYWSGLLAPTFDIVSHTTWYLPVIIGHLYIYLFIHLAVYDSFKPNMTFLIPGYALPEIFGKHFFPLIDSTCALSGPLGPTTWASVPAAVLWTEVEQVIVIEPQCNTFIIFRYSHWIPQKLY